MKKLTRLAAIVGSMLFAMAFVNTASAETNPFAQADQIQQVAQPDGKCGEGKCGDKTKKDKKCGEGKCGDKKKKCGEGKCGDKKAKKDKKCGEGKCGGK